jgi:MFS family permease
MLPMRFFRIRSFTAANSASFCSAASLYGTLFFLSQYFQTVLGYGPLAAGARLMPWTGTLMVCAPIAGALADRLGERRFLVCGLLLQTIGMAWIALIADLNTSYVRILPALIIGGCGLSMAMPSVQKASVGGVRPQEIGQASGAFTMLRQLGGVFGIAVAVAVFASSGSYASPKEFSDGFAPAMGVLAGLAFVGAVAGLWLPGRDRGSSGIGDSVASTVPTLQGVNV